jgi:hypothetical protein
LIYVARSPKGKTDINDEKKMHRFPYIEKTPHIITKMNDNINMNSTIAKSENVCS